MRVFLVFLFGVSTRDSGRPCAATLTVCSHTAKCGCLAPAYVVYADGYKRQNAHERLGGEEER